ncbi:class I SAM-dependent methyltransferase [Chloroflexota bacterium]
MDSDSLRKPILRELIKTLQLPSDSRGLDVGCGAGLQCLLLAEATGPAGQVTGLDISAEMLDYGREIVRNAGLAEQISFQEGDIADLPFDDNTFDYAWSADCVGYEPFEPVSLVKEMMRVIKPGGTVAIAGWSSEKLLPGYPRLEARLEATAAGLAPFVHGKDPELHFMRALGWFKELGLKDSGCKTLGDSVHAPLGKGVRRFLEALFAMRWPGVSGELSSEDLAEFNRLCLAESPDFILNHQDYAAFFTITLFWGKK